jgi:hypothetical protein
MGNVSVAERPTASQEGLSSMELVGWLLLVKSGFLAVLSVILWMAEGVSVFTKFQ